MAQTKHVLKFSSIANFFANAEERRLLARGENAVESNHIKSYHFVPELLMLRGDVHASMKDRCYNVEVNFCKDGEIESVSCTCPRGQFLCHHVAALCIYAHHNISVTDIECRWAAKKNKEDEVKTIDDLYVGKTHVSINSDLTQDEINSFRTSLQQFGTAVGFTWLLRPEPTPDCDLLLDIEAFVYSEEYLLAKDKKQCFLRKVEVSQDTIKKVCDTTIGQSKNENWLAFRKNRLTASNFGIVSAAVRRNKYLPSLYKRLTGYYNLENIKAVQWGIIHEDQALQEFTAETKLVVVSTGLWLHGCGFLGASPDGLVGDNALIEVKCPFRFRDKLMTEELEADHSYIVYLVGGDIMVNKKHEYYHQIQGNLAISGRDICHLFIWTPRENIVVDIHKEENWLSENLNLLQTFYLDKYLPQIICNVFEDI